MMDRLRGRLPFDGETDEDIKKAIISGSPDYNNSNFLSLTYNVGMNDQLDIQCRDAIKGLLQKNPDMRLSADDLMHHPWFADMKTRMKVRPYKPKRSPSSLSPRLRRYEEEEEEEEIYSNERDYVPMRTVRKMMLIPMEEKEMKIVEPERELKVVEPLKEEKASEPVKEKVSESVKEEKANEPVKEEKPDQANTQLNEISKKEESNETPSTNNV